MNDSRSSQIEGYDFYDFGIVAYNAGGGAEVAYIVGTNARAAIPGLTLDSAIWPVSETFPAVPPLFPGLSLPHNAHMSWLTPSTNAWVRFVSRELVTRWILSLAAGAAFSAWPIPTLQYSLAAGQKIQILAKWAIIYVVAQPAALAGNLTVESSG